LKKLAIILASIVVVVGVFVYMTLTAGVVKAPETTLTPTPAGPAQTPDNSTVKVTGKGWTISPKVGDVVRVTGTVTDVTVDPWAVSVDLSVPGRSPARVSCTTNFGAADYNILRYQKKGEEITMEGAFEYTNKEVLTSLKGCKKYK
jgi:hypothetical protein